ncbi:MAG: hypothetical protein RBU37_23190 [Myxococcota bacterium]|jgi:hypothetical protein|nr:hypothetical protein [Myxococcota bacterium]
MSAFGPELGRCIEQLLQAAKAREDALLDLTVGLQPEAPLLLSDARSTAVVAVALRLLHALASRGGTALPMSAISRLEQHFDAALGSSHRALLDEEVMRILYWLEQNLSAEPEQSEPDALSRFPVELKAELVLEAIQSGKDLFLEYYDEASRRYRRLRMRPDRVEQREQPEVIGKRLQYGDLVVLSLGQIRWLMLVERLGSLPVQRLAKVIDFPRGED